VVTDFIEPDLEWEAQQFDQLGIEYSFHQLKLAAGSALAEITADADIIITNMAKFDAKVIACLRNCKLIIRHGVGYDNIDVDAASARGIVVGYVPDYCVQEVAEQSLMLILACRRKLCDQQVILRNSAQRREWEFASIRPIFRLSGETIGIIGCGRVGGTVLRMARGLGLKCLVCDPFIPDKRKQELGVETVSLDKLLRESDVVTVHVPLTDETHHLLGQREFDLMKANAVLVNTARGAIVDLIALDKTLRDGKLAFAGIDVYEDQEPPEPDHPLLNNPRAICTAHLAWLSEESAWAIRARIVEDVSRFLQGEVPHFQVNAGTRLRMED